MKSVTDWEISVRDLGNLDVSVNYAPVEGAERYLATVFDGIRRLGRSVQGSGDTPRDAAQDLAAQLRDRGFTGRLRPKMGLTKEAFDRAMRRERGITHRPDMTPAEMLAAIRELICVDPLHPPEKATPDLLLRVYRAELGRIGDEIRRRVLSPMDALAFCSMAVREHEFEIGMEIDSDSPDIVWPVEAKLLAAKAVRNQIEEIHGALPKEKPRKRRRQMARRA